MANINPETVIANSKFNTFHMLVFIWCFIAIAADGFDIAVYGLALPEMMNDFNITPAAAGAIGSYAMMGMMAGTFILGTLTDVIGRKRVLALCLVIIGLFNFLAGFAQNETIFIIFRFIASVGMGGLMPAVISLMTEYSPRKNRAITVALMYCGYSIGSIIASLFGIYFLEHLSWRLFFWVSIFTVVITPFFLKQFPESVVFHIRRGNKAKIAEILNKVTQTNQYSEWDNYEITAGTTNSSSGISFNKIFNNNKGLSTVMFWIAVICCLMMIAGLGTWLPNIMQESGYGVSSAMIFTITLALGQMAGSLAGGYMVDKIGHRNVLLSLLSIGGITFVLLSITGSTALLFILIAVAGACTAGSQNLINPYITMFYPPDIRGAGLSLAVGMGRIGSITGPLLIGLVLMTNVPPQLSFLGFALPCAIAFCALLFVQEKHGTEVQKRQFKKKSEALAS